MFNNWLEESFNKWIGCWIPVNYKMIKWNHLYKRINELKKQGYKLQKELENSIEYYNPETKVSIRFMKLL